jgi:hypothetical protein
MLGIWYEIKFPSHSWVCSFKDLPYSEVVLGVRECCRCGGETVSCSLELYHWGNAFCEDLRKCTCQEARIKWTVLHFQKLILLKANCCLSYTDMLQEFSCWIFTPWRQLELIFYWSRWWFKVVIYSLTLYIYWYDITYQQKLQYNNNNNNNNDNINNIH